MLNNQGAFSNRKHSVHWRIFICICLLILMQQTSPTVVVGILTLYTESIARILQRSLKNQLPNGFDFNHFLNSTSYLAETYKTWVKSAGMHPILLDINSSDEELAAKIYKIDALLLTGGRQQFYEPGNLTKIPAKYLAKVKKIISQVKSLNRKGERLPIWGTCLGFEALLITQSNFSLIRHFVDNAIKSPSPITIMNFKTKSARFFTQKELFEMSHDSLYYFNHKFGIYAHEFYENKYLRENVDIVATITKNDLPVVTWIEFRKFPFIGTQFHPEKFPFKTKGLLGPEDKMEVKREKINYKLALLFKSQAVDRNRNLERLDCEEKSTIELKNVGSYKSLEIVVNGK